MFRSHRNTKKEIYLILQSTFNGDINATFLRKCKGNAYIVTDSGIYFYDQNVIKCTHLQTSSMINNHKKLLQIINTPELAEGGVRTLSESEVYEISSITEIASIFRGMPGTTKGVDAIYYLAKTLIDDGKHTEEKLKIINENISKNPVLILQMFKANERYAELYGGIHARLKIMATEEQMQFIQKLQGSYDPAMVLETKLIIDAISQLADKSSHQVAEVFSQVCRNQYNDSITAEKWELKIREYASVAHKSC